MTISQASYIPLGWSDWPKKDSRLTTLLKSSKVYSKEIALVVLALSTFTLSVVLLNHKSKQASQTLSYRTSLFFTADGGNFTHFPQHLISIQKDGSNTLGGQSIARQIQKRSQ